MTTELKRILDSKRALRRELTSRPVAEKLRMLDALREREMAIRAIWSHRGQPNARCSEPTWSLLLAGLVPLFLRLCGRLRALFATRDAFQPLDFLHVRQQHRLRRVLGQLRPDGVRLHPDEGEPFMPKEVGSLDAFEERASLVGHGV